MKKNKKIIYLILVAVLIVGGIYGWTVIKDINAHIETDDAQVDGDIVPVITKTGAYVNQVLVKDNQIVKAGELLVVLDSAELYQRLAQAEAAYAAAMAQVTTARNSAQDVQHAQTMARTAMEAPKTNLWHAKSEYDRYRDLYGKGLATEQQLENYKAGVETAQAAYSLAQQKYEETNIQIATAQSQVKVAEATAQLRKKDVEYARLQLSYTRVYAPVAGTVSKKSVQIGQLVQPGQPLMAVVQSNDIWVSANFKETQMEDMRVGQPVQIDVDAYPNLHVHGKVESMGGATGAKFSLLPPDNASGNFVKVVQRVPVRISIDSSAENEQFLKPGLSVRVKVTK